MTTIAELATKIADTHNLDQDEALTGATSYAIQLDGETGVQEGGQAPDVEVDDKTAAHILGAAQAAADL